MSLNGFGDYKNLHFSLNQHQIKNFLIITIITIIKSLRRKRGMGGGRSHEVAREGFRILREEEGIDRHDLVILANRHNTVIASCFCLLSVCALTKKSIFRFFEVSYKNLIFRRLWQVDGDWTRGSPTTLSKPIFVYVFIWKPSPLIHSGLEWLRAYLLFAASPVEIMERRHTHVLV